MILDQEYITSSTNGVTTISHLTPNLQTEPHTKGACSFHATKKRNNNQFSIMAIIWFSQCQSDNPDGYGQNRPATNFCVIMMTSSNGNIFFDLSLNKRLSWRPRRRWFETPSRSLWCHCNVFGYSASYTTRNVGINLLYCLFKIVRAKDKKQQNPV